MIIWISLVLILGFYLVFENLGFLLTAEHTGFYCRLLPDGAGVRLQSGTSVEVIKFKFPLHFTKEGREFILQTSQGTVSLSFAPQLRIRWRKSVARRSSIKNGEY